jgi:hypothetical protein
VVVVVVVAAAAAAAAAAVVVVVVVVVVAVGGVVRLYFIFEVRKLFLTSAVVIMFSCPESDGDKYFKNIYLA